MSIQKPVWSYKEFLAYLLLYAANADFVVNEDEKEMLFSKVNVEDYNNIRRAFEKANDNETIQIIKSFRSVYFNDDASAEKLLIDLKDIFLADQNFDSTERVIFMGLRKILKQ